MANYTK